MYDTSKYYFFFKVSRERHEDRTTPSTSRCSLILLMTIAMPLYELFCLSASRLSQAGLKEIMKKTGRIILSHNGVITDVKSFGEKKLAYCIRRPGERHSTALLWQVTFASGPETVGDIEQGLRLDEDVIRWTVLKRLQTERLPSSYRVAELARKELGRN